MEGHADALLEMRTHFYLGNYQAAINDADRVNNLEEEVVAEKRVLVQRCYLGLGNHALVVSQIEDDAPEEMLVVRDLARFLGGDAGAVADIKAHLAEPSTSELLSNMRAIAGAMANLEEGDLEEALKCASQCTWLEGKAIIVQIFLELNRVDMAIKELAKMQRVDEDAVITQLTQAWAYLAVGGEKAVQAGYIFEELLEKHGQTLQLLNGQAVSKMIQGHFAEAEPLLLMALEKAPNDKTTLINLTVCYRHLNKPSESVERKIKQIRSLPGAHPWLASFDRHSDLFDTAAARYK